MLGRIMVFVAAVAGVWGVPRFANSGRTVQVPSSDLVLPVRAIGAGHLLRDHQSADEHGRRHLQCVGRQCDFDAVRDRRYLPEIGRRPAWFAAPDAHRKLHLPRPVGSDHHDDRAVRGVVWDDPTADREGGRADDGLEYTARNPSVA